MNAALIERFIAIVGAKNAITDAMYDKLAGALEGASHSKSIHCVVITGGKDVFSAGSDLNDFLHAAQHMEGLRPAVGASFWECALLATSASAVPRKRAGMRCFMFAPSILREEVRVVQTPR